MAFSRFNPVPNKFERVDGLVSRIAGGELHAAFICGPVGLGKSFRVIKCFARLHYPRHRLRICENPSIADLVKCARDFASGGVMVVIRADHLLTGKYADLVKDFLKHVSDRTIVFDGNAFRTRVSIIWVSGIDTDARDFRGQRKKLIYWIMDELQDDAIFFSYNPSHILDYILGRAEEGLMTTWFSRGVTRDVISFFCEHAGSLKELSINTLKEICTRRRDDPDNWQQAAQRDLFKQPGEQLATMVLPLRSSTSVSLLPRKTLFQDIANMLSGRFRHALLSESSGQLRLYSEDAINIVRVDAAFLTRSSANSELAMVDIAWVRNANRAVFRMRENRFPLFRKEVVWDVELPPSIINDIRCHLLLAANVARSHKHSLLIFFKSRRIVARIVAPCGDHRDFEFSREIDCYCRRDIEGNFSPEALCWLMKKNLSSIRLNRTPAIGVTAVGEGGDYDFYLPACVAAASR